MKKTPWKWTPKKDKPEKDFLADSRKIKRDLGEVVSDKDTVYQQEVEISEMVDGSRHRGSGSSMYKKSDGSSSRYQIEAKQTKHKSLSLKLEWLEKITAEAIGQKKIPMLALRFLNIGNQLVEQDWIVIPKSEYIDLYGMAKGEKSELSRWEEEE